MLSNGWTPERLRRQLDRLHVQVAKLSEPVRHADLRSTALAEAVDHRINNDYYRHMIGVLADSLETNGYALRTCSASSDLHFQDLPIAVQRRIELDFAVARRKYIAPKVDGWLLLTSCESDLAEGYARRYVTDILDSLSSQGFDLYDLQRSENCGSESDTIAPDLVEGSSRPADITPVHTSC